MEGLLGPAKGGFSHVTAKQDDPCDNGDNDEVINLDDDPLMVALSTSIMDLDYHLTRREIGMPELLTCHVRPLPRHLRHLVDLCGGGLLTGLTTTLENGINVGHYSYVDSSHNARRIA